MYCLSDVYVNAKYNQKLCLLKCLPLCIACLQLVACTKRLLSNSNVTNLADSYPRIASHVHHNIVAAGYYSLGTVVL